MTFIEKRREVSPRHKSRFITHVGEKIHELQLYFILYKREILLSQQQREREEMLQKLSSLSNQMSGKALKVH